MEIERLPSICERPLFPYLSKQGLVLSTGISLPTFSCWDKLGRVKWCRKLCAHYLCALPGVLWTVVVIAPSPNEQPREDMIMNRGSLRRHLHQFDTLLLTVQNTPGAVCLRDSRQFLQLLLLTGAASCLHLPDCLHSGHCLTHYKGQGWGQGRCAARRAGGVWRAAGWPRVGRPGLSHCWPAPALCTAPLSL